MISYLLKSPRHLAQYLACNLLPKGYVYFSTSWIPEGKDALLIDARLILTHDAHLSKERQYRRRKGGHASVKYLRCGRLCVLLATEGELPKGSTERWRDVRKEPLHVHGYAMRIDKDTGKVCVRIHDEAQRVIRREMTLHAGNDVRWWERKIFTTEFLAFRGVQDNVYALLQHLNRNRKLLRKPPVDYKRCIRRRIKVEPVFEESPREIVDLLRYEAMRR